MEWKLMKQIEIEENKMKKAQNVFGNFMKNQFPKNTKLLVKKGRGLMRVVVYCVSDTGNLNVISRTGRHHWISYDQIRKIL